jgi:hypothetical protein
MSTTSVNVYASIILGCFTSPDKIISLIVVQLEPKHVGECMTKFQVSGLPYKCIFVVNKYRIKMPGICNTLTLLKKYLYKYWVYAITW